MQLTDQELWHILQVEPDTKPRPWEPDFRPVPGRVWIEWAKTEVLSGVDASPHGNAFKLYSIYLTRLVRVMDVLGEYGIAPTKSRREGNITLYAESYVNELALNSLEACGCSSERTLNTLSLMKDDGILTDQEFDEWRRGMRSGSGIRKYYGLTFKGKKQAEKASEMPPVCDEANEEMRQDGGAELVGAENAELPKRAPADGKGEMPPLTADKLPEMTAEEWRNAGLTLLMQLAQVYYALLESACGGPCGAVDLELNHSYLWTLESIRNLLAKYPDMADFPIPFEPVFPDLYPSTVRDMDWEDMVAPDAERFLSTVQKYVLNKGTYPPKERSPAWVFIEMFKPGINSAIESGVAYRKRINQDFEKVMDNMVKTAAGRIAGPSPAVATTSPEPQVQKAGTPPEGMERGSITNRRNDIEIAGRARRIVGRHSVPGKVLVLVLDGNEVAELVFLDACADGGAAGKMVLSESFFGWRIPPHQLDSLLTSEDLTGKRKDDPQSFVMASWRAAESTLAGVEGAPERVGSGRYWCRATIRPRTRADGDLLYVDDEERGTTVETLHADVRETKDMDGNTPPQGAGVTPAGTNENTEAPPDMMTIPQAAEYARVTTRAIGNWLKTETGDGPMLKGVRGKGRLTRIPRCALDPYRKPEIARRQKQKTAPNKKVQVRGRRRTN